MTPDWSPLRAELAAWRTGGHVLPLWWRDDDAVAPTDALDRLDALSAETGVPVHLAIVPEGATQALAGSLSDRFIPVAHGWAHRNNALPLAKKAEFGKGRNARVARQDLDRAITRMTDLFGPRLARMFVPPWNRLDPALLPELAALGFDAVSTYLPRTVAEPVSGLEQINTHLDPIFWRGTRGLVDPDTLIAQLVALLRDRRAGITDTAEPLGYLTHHLVHDADIWEFSRQVLTELRDGPITLYRHDRKDIP